MQTPKTKREVRDALGLPNDAALARWFEVSRAAVAQWPEDGELPRLRLLEFHQRRPELAVASASTDPEVQDVA